MKGRSTMRNQMKLFGALVATGLIVAMGTIAASTTTTTTSEAFGLYVDAGATSLAPTPHAVLPGSGMATQAALDLSVAGVAEASDLFATSTGLGQEGDASVEAHSSAEQVNLLGGVVIADAVLAMSSSVLTDDVVESSAEGSSFTDLVVNGVAIDSNVAPNTRIEVPGVGTVVLNEQVLEGDGVTSTGMRVNMIRVELKDAITGATTGEIIVGSARTALSG